jgi:hypothetical protein
MKSKIILISLEILAQFKKTLLLIIPITLKLPYYIPINNKCKKIILLEINKSKIKSLKTNKIIKKIKKKTKMTKTRKIKKAKKDKIKTTKKKSK